MMRTSSYISCFVIHLVSVILLLCLFRCTLAQYGSSGGNGYRKGVGGGGGGGGQGAPMQIPLDMNMIFGPTPGMGGAQKSAYGAAGMGGMRSRGGGGGGYGGSGGTKSKATKMMMSGGQEMMGYGMNGGAPMPVQAAVKSSYSVDYKEVPSEPLNIQPQTILVSSSSIPLNLLFQSKSSMLNLQSEHIPSKGDTQETQSEDEPHRLVHRVTKPIIQEVYEIITPYRKITQEIKPVQEEIQTIVARVAKDNKYEPVMNGGGNGNGKYGGGGGQQMMMMSAPPQPKSYGGNEFSEMMNALKMQLPPPTKSSYMPTMNGYGSGMKQSRMQMYMSQMNELPKPEALMQEAEMSGASNGNQASQEESLPLLELSEPSKPEENAASTTPEMDAQSDEKEVTSAGETSTPSVVQEEREKAMHSLMFYGGTLGAGAGAKQNGQATKSANARSFSQTNSYAESNTEPTGY